MIPPAVFALAAQTDLRNAVEWIAKDNPAAARSLRMAAGRAARRIGDHPAIGAARPGLGAGHYRFLRLRGFPLAELQATVRHLASIESGGVRRALEELLGQAAPAPA